MRERRLPTERAETPKVNALVVCDQIYWEPSTHLPTLLGVRVRLGPQEPSAPGILRIQVYGSLTNLRGTYSLAIQALRGDTEQVTGAAPIEEELTIEDPLDTIEFSGGLAAMLPPGRVPIVIRLLANGSPTHDVVLSWPPEGDAP